MLKRIIDKKRKNEFIFHPHNITGYKICRRNFRIIFGNKEDIDQVWEITNLNNDDLQKLSSVMHSIMMNKIVNDRHYVINTNLRLMQKVSSHYIKFMNFYASNNNTPSSVDMINFDMDTISAMFHYDIEESFPHMNRFEILVPTGCYSIDFHPDGIPNLMKDVINKHIDETIIIGEDKVDQ